jgi:hypothetical protein
MMSIYLNQKMSIDKYRDVDCMKNEITFGLHLKYFLARFRLVVISLHSKIIDYKSKISNFFISLRFFILSVYVFHKKLTYCMTSLEKLDSTI